MILFIIAMLVSIGFCGKRQMMFRVADTKWGGTGGDAKVCVKYDVRYYKKTSVCENDENGQYQCWYDYDYSTKKDIQQCMNGPFNRNTVYHYPEVEIYPSSCSRCYFEKYPKIKMWIEGTTDGIGIGEIDDVEFFGYHKGYGQVRDCDKVDSGCSGDDSLYMCEMFWLDMENSNMEDTVTMYFKGDVSSSCYGTWEYFDL